MFKYAKSCWRAGRVIEIFPPVMKPLSCNSLYAVRRSVGWDFRVGGERWEEANAEQRNGWVQSQQKIGCGVGRSIASNVLLTFFLAQRRDSSHCCWCRWSVMAKTLDNNWAVFNYSDASSPSHPISFRSYALIKCGLIFISLKSSSSHAHQQPGQPA